MKQVFIIIAVALFMGCSQENSDFFEEQNLIKEANKVENNGNLQTRAADGPSESDCWEIWCEIKEHERLIGIYNSAIQKIYNNAGVGNRDDLHPVEEDLVMRYEQDIYREERQLQLKERLYMDCIEYANME